MEQDGLVAQQPPTLTQNASAMTFWPWCRTVMVGMIGSWMSEKTQPNFKKKCSMSLDRATYSFGIQTFLSVRLVANHSSTYSFYHENYFFLLLFLLLTHWSYMEAQIFISFGWFHPLYNLIQRDCYKKKNKKQITAKQCCVYYAKVHLQYFPLLDLLKYFYFNTFLCKNLWHNHIDILVQ